MQSRDDCIGLCPSGLPAFQADQAERFRSETRPCWAIRSAGKEHFQWVTDEDQFPFPIGVITDAIRIEDMFPGPESIWEDQGRAFTLQRIAAIGDQRA